MLSRAQRRFVEFFCMFSRSWLSSLSNYRRDHKAAHDDHNLYENLFRRENLKAKKFGNVACNHEHNEIINWKRHSCIMLALFSRCSGVNILIPKKVSSWKQHDERLRTVAIYNSCATFLNATRFSKKIKLHWKSPHGLRFDYAGPSPD